MFAQPARTGTSSSFTVTVKLHVPEFIELSVDVHVTVVAPLLNTLPLAGTHAVVALQLSLAAGIV